VLHIACSDAGITSTADKQLADQLRQHGIGGPLS